MVSATQGMAIQELTEAEARSLLDERVQRRLGMNLDEFIHRWQSGAYGAPDDDPDALETATLLPWSAQTRGAMAQARRAREADQIFQQTIGSDVVHHASDGLFVAFGRTVQGSSHSLTAGPSGR